MNSIDRQKSKRKESHRQAIGCHVVTGQEYGRVRDCHVGTNVSVLTSIHIIFFLFFSFFYYFLSGF